MSVKPTPEYSTVEDANRNLYDTYYNKPFWWWTFRYATQIKKKTCLHLVKAAGKSLKYQKVLEIGFGCGSTLFSFDKSSEIYGLEMSKSAIKQAEKNATRKKFRRWHFNGTEQLDLPFESGIFDIVIASHVLEHVEDDQFFLEEMKRVLKPDGIAVVLIPVNEKYDDPRHMHHYSSEKFIELAQMKGLNTILQHENDLISRWSEWYYYGGGWKRYKIFGAIFALGFNLATSLWPYKMYGAVEKWFAGQGYTPRQAGFVLAHENQNPEVP